jgi:cell division transport system ATP-binding protein
MQQNKAIFGKLLLIMMVGVAVLIYMEGVSKVYDNGSVALADVSVEIPQGDFVFVVGPSGAGKSTFIKLIIREELASSGVLVVNGRNVGELEHEEIPYFRRSQGIVFQDYRLLPNKTVYENVAFAMMVIEAAHREIQKRVNHVLDLVGLRHKARSFPSELSGGEQQRIAIARAIVNKPVLVIADEPTGNLDPETSWDIMRIFEKINHDGTTVVMATHDKTVVDAMKRRVIAIEKGRIARDEVEGVYGYEN